MLVCVVDVVVVWLNDGAVCVTDDVGVASVLVRVKLSDPATLISVRVNAVMRTDIATDPELCPSVTVVWVNEAATDERFPVPVVDSIQGQSVYSEIRTVFI